MILTWSSCRQNQLNLRALHDGLTFLDVMVCDTLHPVQRCTSLHTRFSADADGLGCAFGGLAGVAGGSENDATAIISGDVNDQ